MSSSTITQTAPVTLTEGAIEEIKRLMAEDGISDYQQAKRKAARQLGLDEHVGLPDNAEVESELRIYRSLYQDEGHAEMISAMRHSALGLLNLLEP